MNEIMLHGRQKSYECRWPKPIKDQNSFKYEKIKTNLKPLEPLSVCVSRLCAVPDFISNSSGMFNILKLAVFSGVCVSACFFSIYPI